MTRRATSAPTKPDAARGVWVAPWFGQNGETVLVAIRRDGRLVEQRMIPVGHSHGITVDALFERLEAEDPAPTLALVR